MITSKSSIVQPSSLVYILQRLSLQDKFQLSFWKHLGHQELSMPYSSEFVVHKITNGAYQIKDHGFAEASYQQAFKKDVGILRDRYKICKQVASQ